MENTTTNYKGKKYQTTPENISRLIEQTFTLCITYGVKFNNESFQDHIEAILEPLLVADKHSE